jgi:hypothetical protein
MKNLSVSEIKALPLFVRKNFDAKKNPYGRKEHSFPRIEWAITYLAFGEMGRGLEDAKFELAMNFAREWKSNMVNFLIGKPIKGEPNKTHTRETALAVADAIFKAKYEAEVKAHQSPTMNTYFTRHIETSGGLEYGELMVDKISRLDEVDTAISWLPSKRYTPAKRQKANMGQFLVYLARGVSPSKVLKNARACAWNGAITWDQFKNLRDIAGDIMVQVAKSKPEMDVAL